MPYELKAAPCAITAYASRRGTSEVKLTLHVDLTDENMGTAEHLCPGVGGILREILKREGAPHVHIHPGARMPAVTMHVSYDVAPKKATDMPVRERTFLWVGIVPTKCILKVPSHAMMKGGNEEDSDGEDRPVLVITCAVKLTGEEQKKVRDLKEERGWLDLFETQPIMTDAPAAEAA